MDRKISIVYSLHVDWYQKHNNIKYPIDLFKKNACSTEVDFYRNYYKYEDIYYLSRKDLDQDRIYGKERYHGPRPS